MSEVLAMVKLDWAHHSFIGINFSEHGFVADEQYVVKTDDKDNGKYYVLLFRFDESRCTEFFDLHRGFQPHSGQLAFYRELSFPKAFPVRPRPYADYPPEDMY